MKALFLSFIGLLIFSGCTKPVKEVAKEVPLVIIPAESPVPSPVPIDQKKSEAKGPLKKA